MLTALVVGPAQIVAIGIEHGHTRRPNLAVAGGQDTLSANAGRPASADQIEVLTQVRDRRVGVERDRIHDPGESVDVRNYDAVIFRGGLRVPRKGFQAACDVRGGQQWAFCHDATAHRRADLASSVISGPRHVPFRKNNRGCPSRPRTVAGSQQVPCSPSRERCMSNRDTAANVS
jgi:hypothetical protein